MRDRQTCIECGKKSPETETNYTLISAQFGWRLTRRRDDNGDFVVEWRCADCWRSHKKRTENDPPSMVMPVRPPVDKAPSDKGGDKTGGDKTGGEKAATGAARPSSRPSSRSPSKPPSSIPAASPPPRTKRT